jgi:two-component system chemotaxis response regulator CheY
MKILLVDDSPTILKFLVKILNKFNYPNVITADSAKEAFVVINNIPVDLILLDWNMPYMNGLEFLQILKNTNGLRQIPIIMVTIEKSIDKIKEAIDNGAEGYIVKPINIELLKIRLKDIEESNLLGLKQ